jgi:exonuclease I
VHKIQSDSWVKGIAIGDDSWAIVIKNVHISKCPILNGYGVMAASSLEKKVSIIEKIWNKNNKKHVTWEI